MSQEVGTCQICKKTRKISMLKSSKTDGAMALGMACEPCMARTLSASKRMRELSTIICWSLALDPSPCHFKINGRMFGLEYIGDPENIADAVPVAEVAPEMSPEEAEVERRRLRQEELDRLCPQETPICWQEEKEWRNPLAEKPKRK